MTLRVLHLVHWLNRGGIENWLLDFVRAADRGRLAMDVCCRGPRVGDMAPQFEAAGAAIRHVPLGWNHAGFGRRLGRELRSGGYDLLHVHAGSFAGYPCKVARRNGVAAVVTAHNTRFVFEVRGLASALSAVRAAYTRHSFRVACRECGAIVGCSRAALDAVTELTRMPADQRYHVVHYGIGRSWARDPARANGVRTALSIDPAAPVAIHVGVMRDQKNHAGLLRIADRVRRSLPTFKLLLVGDGPLRPAIERQIRDSNLDDVVRVLGTRSDVDSLLDAADLTIFPSLWEGLPVALIEAQAKGLPVVGSDIGPLKEVTRNGVTSLLFPPGDESAMAAATLELFADPARRREMGARAARLASDEFSVASNVERYMEIYTRAVHAARSGLTPSSA